MPVAVADPRQDWELVEDSMWVHRAVLVDGTPVCLSDYTVHTYFHKEFWFAVTCPRCIDRGDRYVDGSSYHPDQDPHTYLRKGRR